MCGFAGVVSWEKRCRVTEQTLDAMSRRIAHRGPDGQGLWINAPDIDPAHDRPQAGLVHRRLAILDIDPRANQPFTDGAGRWIAFNGEIYNFRELRRELTQLRPDYRWKTECDTEVLLIAYDAWGASCVEHLNGMFAVAVWDQPAAKLFLARDRMGQKPLYYCDARDGVIAFASEIPALLEADWISRDFRPDGVFEYLRRGCQSDGETIYESVSQLKPGWTMTIGQSGVEHASAYFRPNDRLELVGRDPVQHTRRLVTDAVRKQLVSDVPLGVFLSGGIDSSVIAAAASKHLAQAGALLDTFSIGFDDPAYDETRFAEQVARHLKTRHHAFTVRPDAAADLPKLAAAFGEPFADSSALPTYHLATQTRSCVKVALSGDGGDELFGGYDRYRAMPLAELLHRFCPPRLSKTARRMLPPGAPPKSLTARLRRFYGSLSLSAAERYASYGEIFSAGLAAALMNTPASAWPESRHAGEFEHLQMDRDVVQAALALDRATYLPDDLLTKVDRCSMLHALEVRSPFMDHDLVRFAAGLSTPQLLHGGKKRMLREAFARDLPRWVFTRRKMGFAVPIGQWFRNDLREMLRDTLFATGSFAHSHFDHALVQRLVDDHQARTEDNSQRLYALLMLELWWSTSR